MIGTRTFLAVAVLAQAGLHPHPCNARQEQENPQPTPVGFGTLRREDVAVPLDGGNIQIRVLPLHESILRLLATDSYSALHALREASEEDIRNAAQSFGVAEPGVFLVTVFAAAEQAQFDPEQLTITSRNRLFRPIAILPLSPLWHQHRLTQRETATAVYVFEDGIALLEPLSVDYGGIVSHQWQQSLRRIERERARIAARIRA